MLNWVMVVGGALLMGCLIVVAYEAGRRESQIMAKYTELLNRPKPAEPEKPTVTGGSYGAPKTISPVPDTKRSAGLIETKTPEQLQWQQSEEIEKAALGR